MEGGRRDLVLEQVWFPLDQRPGVGLFVQAECPEGELRQSDVAPPNWVAMERISAAVLPALTPPCPRPLYFFASLLPTHPPTLLEQSPNGSSKLFTDVLCLCVTHESCVESSCQCPRTRLSQKTESCDGYVNHM